MHPETYLGNRQIHIETTIAAHTSITCKTRR